MRVQDVAWNLHPKQHGPYTVALRFDAETWLFRQLSDITEPRAWMVEVLEARCDVDETACSAMRSEDNDVNVVYTVRLNRGTAQFRCTLQVPVGMLEALTPILP
jgi:hypothetical protein